MVFWELISSGKALGPIHQLLRDGLSVSIKYVLYKSLKRFYFSSEFSKTWWRCSTTSPSFIKNSDETKVFYVVYITNTFNRCFNIKIGNTVIDIKQNSVMSAGLCQEKTKLKRWLYVLHAQNIKSNTFSILISCSKIERVNFFSKSSPFHYFDSCG